MVGDLLSDFVEELVEVLFVAKEVCFGDLFLTIMAIWIVFMEFALDIALDEGVGDFDE